MAAYHHVPVMAAEVLAALRGLSRVVDCTAGGGGHSALLASAGARVLALDVDGAAVRAARARLVAAAVPLDRTRVVQASYARLAALLAGGEAPWQLTGADDGGAADGILVDLGASSHQLDPAAGRGFSLRDESSLDMRFWSGGADEAVGSAPAPPPAGGGPAGPGLRASDLVNGCSEGELTLLLRDFGEEPHAAHIARAIVAARPLSSAAALARCVGAAASEAARARTRRSGGGGGGGGGGASRRDTGDGGSSRHPATRALQALRIAVNGELDALQRLLRDAPALLAPGGRFAALSFHSLEDRMVKSAFRDLVQSGGWVHAATPAGAAFARASAGEVSLNPRARSATLRVVERQQPRNFKR